MQFKKPKGRVILLYLLLPLTLVAKLPQNISSFDNLPRSIAKDYYIYRFLNEKNVSNSGALKLLSEAKIINSKLFNSFAKKIDDVGFRKIAKCLKLKTKKLLKQDNNCIAIGLSIQDALSLNKNELKNLSVKLSTYGDINETLKILSSPNIFNSALKDKDKFTEILNSSGAKNRKIIFDKTLTKKDINELSNLKKFNKSIEIILTQRNLKNLQKSLLLIKINPNLTQKSLFFLGLNALEFNKNDLALSLFDKAYQKAYYRFDKDKILFWEYQITKNEKYIKQLMLSFDVNIYTIYAHEIKSSKFKNIISPQIKANNLKYNIKNPFLWTNLLRSMKDINSTKLENLAKKFKHKNTIGQYTFLKERAEGYKNSYFPMPFYNLLQKYNKKRIALILSLARQESRFIPASVSSSYALGMMQFMPFLAKAIAKDKKIKNFDLDEMFNPKIAYSFANKHLDYLSKYLYNPLLIAYAYNGGIGYVKKLLKSGNFFKKGKYEPFLSMELINYPESRKYGKKVLANYIIYMQLLGKKSSFNSLSQNLMKHSYTDKFQN